MKPGCLTGVLGAAVLSTTAIASSVGGCEGLDAGAAVADGHEIRWHVLSDEVDELRAWCSAVGAPLIINDVPGPQDTSAALVVSWNVDVGAGRLDDFLDDLLAGKWTDGTQVSDYVLLLQEAYRADDSIPRLAPKGSKKGNAIHHGEEDFHADVLHFARERNLNLFYVPLMRNGDDREDRGNAILSTFPMSEFAAYELPPQRQRRVTASAMVSGTTAGRPWSVRVINVHLENRGRWKSPLSTFGSARTDQMSRLLDAVGMRLEATIMGGDFNVWAKEGNEGAIKLIRAYLAQAGELDTNRTVNPGKKLPERRVDYLFHSRDRDWNVSYRRVDDRYDSDHYPILIHITPDPAVADEISSDE